MKLMFASDIHGSSYFCRKMLEMWKKEKAPDTAWRFAVPWPPK